MTGVACLVEFTTIIAPGLPIAMFLYVLLPLRFDRQAPGVFHVFHYLNALQPWGMVEVFMLGVLASIVKLSKMAMIVQPPRPLIIREYPSCLTSPRHQREHTPHPRYSRVYAA